MYGGVKMRSEKLQTLNKQAKEAVALGEPFRGEQLQLIGELAVALVQKGCLLQVVIQGKDELALDIQAAQRRGDYAKTAALEAVRDLRDNE